MIVMPLWLFTTAKKGSSEIKGDEREPSFLGGLRHPPFLLPYSGIAGKRLQKSKLSYNMYLSTQVVRMKQQWIYKEQIIVYVHKLF